MLPAGDLRGHGQPLSQLYGVSVGLEIGFRMHEYYSVDLSVQRLGFKLGLSVQSLGFRGGFSV